MTTFPSDPVASYHPISGGRNVTSLYLRGIRLHLRAHLSSFEIIDVSTPTSPSYVGSVNIDRALYGTMGQMNLDSLCPINEWAAKNATAAKA